VLLDFIAERFIGQEEREVRPEIKPRAREKSVHLEDIAAGQILPVVGAEDSGPDAPAVLRVNEAEAIQHPRSDLVERNLSGRKEVVASEVELETELLILIRPADVVASDIIALVFERVFERPVSPRAFIGDQSAAAFKFRTVGQERAKRAE